MKTAFLSCAAVLVLGAAPVLAQNAYQPRDMMKGAQAEVGAGVEAYTGSLAPVVQPGPSWAARLGFKPTKILGLELNYTGATNNLDSSASTRPLELSTGPDLVRNGGQAVATVGLTETVVQPYLLAGVGVSRYTVRGEPRPDFVSDTTGNIPLGAGVRAHFGLITADARFGYNVLFDQGFATNIVHPNSFSSGRYDGTLNIGAVF